MIDIFQTDSKTPKKEQKAAVTKASTVGHAAAFVAVPSISAKNSGVIMPATIAIAVPLTADTKNAQSNLSQPSLQQSKKGASVRELDLTTNPSQQGLQKVTPQELSRPVVSNTSQLAPDSMQVKLALPTKPKSECSKAKGDNPRPKKKESLKRKREEPSTAKQRKDTECSGAKKRSQSQGEVARRPANPDGKLCPKGKVPRVEKQAFSGKLSTGGKAPPGVGTSVALKVPPGGRDLSDVKVKPAGKRSPGIKVTSPDQKMAAESKIPPAWAKTSPGLKVSSGCKTVSNEGLKVPPTAGKTSPTGVKTPPGLKTQSGGLASPGGKGQNGGKTSPKISPTGKAPDRLLPGSKVQAGSKVSPKSPNGSKVSPGAKSSTSSGGKASTSSKGASGGKQVTGSKGGPQREGLAKW